MKSFLLAFVVLQAFQYCAAIPVLDFLPIIEDALSQSIIQLNSDTTSGYLFAAINNELLHVSPTGPNEISVDLRFNARETLCPKNSGMEVENCELNRSPSAEIVTCHSSVTYSSGTFVDVFLRCKDARTRIMDSISSSSSFESSEEILFQRRSPQFQDEYYSSVDWNNRPSGQRRRNGSAAGKKNNQRQNLSQGLSSKKIPRRKQNPDSVAE
ncbi:secreted phosphoprotein 24-like [Pristis pectinata]|uniref:secreted phosphoprotein 24-like n=1 Tax=Pristis pectinata TaxID=685728 RepID=UPI00223DEE96|nr:secreted phosphoprotein 24-like [Pristis pectinata]